MSNGTGVPLCITTTPETAEASGDGGDGRDLEKGRATSLVVAPCETVMLPLVAHPFDYDAAPAGGDGDGNTLNDAGRRLRVRLLRPGAIVPPPPAARGGGGGKYAMGLFVGNICCSHLLRGFFSDYTQSSELQIIRDSGLLTTD